MTTLLHGERLDDLGRCGRRLIQNTAEFCFGADAVLLAHFPRWRKSDRVLDLGTGAGVIPLLIADEVSHVAALELNPVLYDLARRNAELNGLTEKITVQRGDLRQITSLYPVGGFDRVIVNPPYYPTGKGKISVHGGRAAARHEMTATLTDVIKAARFVLRYGGKLAMVHIPSRLSEIVAELATHQFSLQRLRPVQPTAEKPANLILLEAAVSTNKAALKIEPALVMRDASGAYTAAVRQIYGE